MFSFFCVCDNNPGIVENFSLFSFFSSFVHFSYFFIYIFFETSPMDVTHQYLLRGSFRSKKVIPAKRTNNLLCCPSVCVCVFVRLSV